MEEGAGTFWSLRSRCTPVRTAFNWLCNQLAFWHVGRGFGFSYRWQHLQYTYIASAGKKKFTTTRRGPPKVPLCLWCNATKELRTKGMERVTEELITSQQHVGCLYKYGGRKKGRRRCKEREPRPQLMGE